MSCGVPRPCLALGRLCSTTPALLPRRAFPARCLHHAAPTAPTESTAFPQRAAHATLTRLASRQLRSALNGGSVFRGAQTADKEKEQEKEKEQNSDAREDSGVRLLTLVRPEAKNAISRKMLDEMAAGLAHVQADE